MAGPRSRHLLAAAAAAALAACSTSSEPFTPSPRPTAQFENIPFADWTAAEPDYRLYPGDEIEISVPSAPELNRSAVVQPDGRIILPLASAPIMVADRPLAEVQAAVGQAYAAQLLRPDVEIAVKAAGPLKVFVGGEVQNPGVYELPGDMDALRAVIMAGGFTNAANRRDVVILRRGYEDRPMMRTADLVGHAVDPASEPAVPLRRFDVIYVPRTRLGEVGLAMASIRDAIPLSFGFNFDPSR